MTKFNAALVFITLLHFCCSISTAQPLPVGQFKLFFEKVYLHTDQNSYVAGEDIWFKAYLLDAQSYRPTKTSNNLYVELISPADTILTRQLIRIDNGTGHGDMTLPQDAVSGIYRLRAYTNWMRNFGGNFIFEKQLIVNGYAAPTIIPQNSATANAAATIATVKPGNIPPATVSVTFHPEGGSLVQQITGIVAVKALNNTGEPVIVKGAVIALPANDTVSRFSTDSTGMGSFALLPLKGQTYQAVYRHQNLLAKVDLPKALSSGPALRVYLTDSTWMAAITCADGTNDRSLLMVIKHSGKTYITQEVDLSKLDQRVVAIPQKLLPPGIACITLYDSMKRPCCERLIYMDDPAQKINVTLNTDKPGYSPYEKTTLDLAITDAQNRPIAADLSVAVTNAAAVPADVDDIASYLLLRSELKGEIANYDRYFDTANPNRSKQLDLLLLTQGWRQYLWRTLVDTSLNITRLPERGLNIQGRLVEPYTGRPLPTTSISLFATNAKEKLLSTVTDGTGHYAFDAIEQYGAGPLVLKAYDKQGKNAGTFKPDTLQNSSLPIVLRSPQLVAEQYNAALKLASTPGKWISDTLKLKEVKVTGTNNIMLRDVTVTSFGYPDEVLTPGNKDNKDRTVRDYLLFASKQARYEAGDNDRLDRIVFYAEGRRFDPRLIVNGYEVPIESADEITKNDLYNQYFNLRLSKVEKVVIKRMLAPMRIGIPQSRKGFVNMQGPITDVKTTILPEPIFIIFLTLKPGALDAEKRNAAAPPEPIKLKEVKVDATQTVLSRNGPFINWGADQVFDISAKDSTFKTLEWYLLQNAKGAQQSTKTDSSGVVFMGRDTIPWSSQTRAKLLPPAFFVNGRELYMDEHQQAEAYRQTYFNMPIERFKKVILRHVVGNLAASIPNSHNIDSEVSKRALIDRYFLYLYLNNEYEENEPGILRTTLQGYYQAREFYKPIYDKPDTHTKPDLRNTILWQPKILTDATGKATISYYNGTAPKARIVIQGITSTGVPVHSTVTYEVK